MTMPPRISLDTIQNKYGLFNVGSTSNFMQPKYLPFSAWPYFDRYYIQGDGLLNYGLLIFPIINLYFPLEHKEISRFLKHVRIN